MLFEKFHCNSKFKYFFNFFIIELDECINQINTDIEEKFFAEIERQLENVCSFYRGKFIVC